MARLACATCRCTVRGYKLPYISGLDLRKGTAYVPVLRKYWHKYLCTPVLLYPPYLCTCCRPAERLPPSPSRFPSADFFPWPTFRARLRSLFYFSLPSPQATATSFPPKRSARSPTSSTFFQSLSFRSYSIHPSIPPQSFHPLSSTVLPTKRRRPPLHRYRIILKHHHRRVGSNRLSSALNSEATDTTADRSDPRQSRPTLICMGTPPISLSICSQQQASATPLFIP